MEKIYYLKDSNERVEFGDTITFTLVKEDEDGKVVNKQVECKFIPDILPLLLAEEVIIEKEKPISFEEGETKDPEDTKEAPEGSEEEEDDSLVALLHLILDVIYNQGERLIDLEKKLEDQDKRYKHCHNPFKYVREEPLFYRVTKRTWTFDGE